MTTTTTAPVVTKTRRALWRPQSHWLLFALVLITLAVALGLQGYARRQIGRSTTASSGHGQPVGGLEGVGPVIDLSGSDVRSVAPPPRTVALTFDDGPDRRWTPQVLDVLRRHGVKATFFVVGAQVVTHPGLVRRAAQEGHELGVHTFTHVSLGKAPGWRTNLELSLTQTALGGAANVHTGLLRLPYVVHPAELPVDEFRAARSAARRGYLLVMADRDSRDWQRPGVDTIVANATPPGDGGAIVLLHDGGGDRSQTVLAVDRLITELRARGYRFATVSEIARVPRPSAMARVQTSERLQGLALIWAMTAAFAVTRVFIWLVIPVGIFVILRALLLALFARRHARAGSPDAWAPAMPDVSIVVPAFNEEVGIARTVQSLASSRYRSFEIVVVDDGSTDATADIVESLDEPRVTLVRQENQGKAGALQTGIDRARHDIVVTVDGDTLFEPDTLAHLVLPFGDPQVGAVSGNTKVGNRRGVLGRWQHIEYVIGFNLDRRMFHLLDCMPTVPGAVGAFRRAALRDAGGVSDDTLAEDTDLTMAINRAGWKVVYQEAARAWTEAPSTLGALFRQRYRWSYGTMQSIWKHKAAIWRRGERSRLGRMGLPYLLVFQVLMPLLAPVVDLFTVYGFAVPGSPARARVLGHVHGSAAGIGHLCVPARP